MKFLRTLFAGLLSTAAVKAADSTTTKNPAEMMRAMRTAWLTRVPEKGEFESDDQVVAVLMDWPLGENTATVLASAGGDASLYTTSTFGIIGGIGHERVRKAAIQFVGSAQNFLDLTSPTTDFPYPDGETLRFYFVTPAGVRTVSFPMRAVEVEKSPARALFFYGQQVLTELRLTGPDQE